MTEQTEKKNKIYPKTSSDSRWIKFFFDYQDKHYTIRFSGNPILTLEYLYMKRGWKDFNKTYNESKLNVINPNTELLRQCGTDIIEMQEAFFLMDEDNKSPFVVYVNDYNEFR